MALFSRRFRRFSRRFPFRRFRRTTRGLFRKRRPTLFRTKRRRTFRPKMKMVRAVSSRSGPGQFIKTRTYVNTAILNSSGATAFTVFPESLFSFAINDTAAGDQRSVIGESSNLLHHLAMYQYYRIRKITYEFSLMNQPAVQNTATGGINLTDLYPQFALWLAPRTDPNDAAFTFGTPAAFANLHNSRHYLIPRANGKPVRWVSRPTFRHDRPVQVDPAVPATLGGDVTPAKGWLSCDDVKASHFTIWAALESPAHAQPQVQELWISMRTLVYVDFKEFIPDLGVTKILPKMEAMEKLRQVDVKFIREHSEIKFNGGSVKFNVGPSDVKEDPGEETDVDSDEEEDKLESSLGAVSQGMKSPGGLAPLSARATSIIIQDDGGDSRVSPTTPLVHHPPDSHTTSTECSIKFKKVKV